ncbi:MAG: polysaccharide deacetylase family protein, partial [Oscillospiraceae bacterium]
MITSICFGISVGRSKKQIAQLENQLEAAGVMLPESGDEAAASGTDEALGQDEVPTETDFDLAYQSLYPELYCENYRPQDWSREQYTAYLTFDDGPSANTEEILEILRKADIKATFFV